MARLRTDGGRLVLEVHRGERMPRTGIDRERRFDEACGREDTHRIPLLIGLSTGEGSRVVHFDDCPSIRVDVGQLLLSSIGLVDPPNISCRKGG